MISDEVWRAHVEVHTGATRVTLFISHNVPPLRFDTNASFCFLYDARSAAFTRSSPAATSSMISLLTDGRLEESEMSYGFCVRRDERQIWTLVTCSDEVCHYLQLQPRKVSSPQGD